MSGGDLYAVADDLVLRLRAEGADKWADSINDAIDSGSTGTEILMALRFCLEQLISADDTTEPTKKLATSLKTEIDTTLEA